MKTQVVLIGFLLVMAGATALGCSSLASREPASLAGSGTVSVLSHDLAAELSPSTHGLLARDRITVRNDGGDANQLTFTLSPKLTVSRVGVSDGKGIKALSYKVKPADSGEDPSVSIVIDLPLPLQSGRTMNVSLEYEGIIDDPPQGARHLRFTTPSETSGHIGEQGVYLSAETRWYPDIPGSLATYRVRATVPAGWEVVTQGREVSRGSTSGNLTTTWEVSTRTEALTLVANRFVKRQRLWQGIEVATYLFPEDDELAEEYLAATERYLDTYTRLLGPYPFPKFAVVENFFPSGLGLPSFTLLGNRVIRRHYTQPYALGHEIVHSWLGNAVFNDLTQGNWVEGLTTYLANYYYEELHGVPEKSPEERRRMLVGYAVYVWPDQDYPVVAFHRKTDQRDNAIGYQKAAMVFHMLRREIGDLAFWAALRTFAERYLGRYAAWPDLERAFSAAAGRDLRWFFSQWVERPGAPELILRHVESEPDRTTPQRYTLTMQLEQSQARAYRLRIPVVMRLAGGEAHVQEVVMEQRTQVVRLTVPGRPTLMQIDPEYHLFRRVPRNQLPPMLNLFVTDRGRALVVPTEGDETARGPYDSLAGHVSSRSEGETIDQTPGADAVLVDASLLLLGGPALNPPVEWAVTGCPEDVALRGDAFTVGGRTYQEPEMALLISCRHPSRPERVVTIFYGLSPEAAGKVARLLFFYGWQSYLIFENGRPVTRGDFEPKMSPLERRLSS